MPPPVALFLLGLGFSLLSSAQSAQADTLIAYNVTADVSRTVTYTLNYNKSTYAPGEIINITASGIVSYDCGNPCDIPGQCRGVGLWIENLDYIRLILPQYIIPLADGYTALGIQCLVILHDQHL